MAKKLKKEELELMSYNEIARIFLKETPNKTTLDLFTEIVEVLELPKQTIETKIGEFYTSLTNDKSFVLLEDGTWDLQQNHKSQSINEEDIEEYEEEIEEYDDTIPDREDEDEDMYEENQDDDIADITEEYKNLVIVDEEELEQE